MCFWDREPGGLVTLGWAGWSGRRALAKNWEERRVRCSLTGRYFDSE